MTNFKQWMLGSVLCCVGGSLSYAAEVCTLASDLTSPRFCETFKLAAQCNCSNKLSKRACNSMDGVYSKMIAFYGSLQRACELQHLTSVQDCKDGWNCYRHTDYTIEGQYYTVDGRLCSGTGRSCG